MLPVDVQNIILDKIYKLQYNDVMDEMMSNYYDQAGIYFCKLWESIQQMFIKRIYYSIVVKHPYNKYFINMIRAQLKYPYRPLCYKWDKENDYMIDIYCDHFIHDS